MGRAQAAEDPGVVRSGPGRLGRRTCKGISGQLVLILAADVATLAPEGRHVAIGSGARFPRSPSRPKTRFRRIKMEKEVDGHEKGESEVCQE